MADDPFPFLDLPILVVVKTLRTMGFIDLYILSQISPLMKSLIKRDVKKKDYKIAVDIRKDGEFDFNFLKDGWPLETLISEPLEYQEIYEWDISGVYRVAWHDSFNGAKIMYKEIADVFAVPVDSVKIHLPSIQENYKPVTRWLKKIAPKISKAEIMGKPRSDFLAYTWTMEQLRPSKELKMLAEPRDYHEKGTLKLNAEKVVIDHGRWVSVHNLVEIKSSDIRIQRSSIPTQNIIWLLHRLRRRGAMPNLKYLSIEFEQWLLPDCEAIFNSLGLVLAEDEPEGEFQLKNGDNCWIGCVVVRRAEVIRFTGFELKIGRGEEQN
ncbi:unnamed protein product [Caenorhabditis brenneri]